MVSEAVQTNGINNGNSHPPYIVSSNNFQMTNTQQNVVVPSSQTNAVAQTSLPSKNELRPGVTSQSHMSSQSLSSQYNPSDYNFVKTKIVQLLPNNFISKKWNIEHGNPVYMSRIIWFLESSPAGSSIGGWESEISSNRVSSSLSSTRS